MDCAKRSVVSTLGCRQLTSHTRRWIHPYVSWSFYIHTCVTIAAWHYMSLYLSVCLSITGQCSVKMAKRVIMRVTLLCSPGSLGWNSLVSNGGDKCTWAVKNLQLVTNNSLYQKRSTRWMFSFCEKWIGSYMHFMGWWRCQWPCVTHPKLPISKLPRIPWCLWNAWGYGFQIFYTCKPYQVLAIQAAYMMTRCHQMGVVSIRWYI